MKTLKKSVLSVIGKSITPAFAPLGIEADNWPATVGLFTGMFAKEAIVGTLDALYTEQENDENSAPPNLLQRAVLHSPQSGQSSGACRQSF